MAEIVVCPLSGIGAALKKSPSMVLSIIEPRMMPNLTGLGDFEHVRVPMFDIVQKKGWMPTPSAADARTIISAARRWDQSQPMVIHCLAGLSRSTAAALISLCTLRPGQLDENVAALKGACPRARPNMLVMAHADKQLACGGALLSAVVQMQAKALAGHGRLAKQTGTISI